METPTECNIMAMKDGKMCKGPKVTAAKGRLGRMKMENKPLDMMIRK